MKIIFLASSVVSLFAVACAVSPDTGSSEADLLSGAVCTPAQCGPEPEVPTKKCANGTYAGPKCVEEGKSCGWIITHCDDLTIDDLRVTAKQVCSASDCGPKPELLEKCPDGQILGPVCEGVSTSECHWELPKCPGSIATSVSAATSSF